MIVKLLVLTLVGFVASQGIVDPRCTVPDPNPAIRLPHETDCTRHWLCQRGSKHLMPPCTGGNNFDSVSLTCRPIADAVCGPVVTTTTAPGDTTTTGAGDTTTTVADDTTTTNGVASTAPPLLPTVPNLPPTVGTVPPEGEPTTTEEATVPV